MTSVHRFLLAVLLLPVLLFPLATTATAGERVDGEASRYAPSAPVHWRIGKSTGESTPSLRYGELSAERIATLHEANHSRAAKATQIGIGRTAATESARKALPGLQWQAAPGGGHAARFEVTSPVALGLRVGLRFDGLPAAAQLRFGGSELPLGELLLMHGHEVANATLPDGLFWSPATDGETQAIEIFLPAGIDPVQVRVQAPQLSHLLANSRRNFKIVEKIGESGSCNVDTACRVAELGAGYVHAKNAVAHMVFVKSGASYVCTGTLLNDTVPGTQEPWFYSAHHCIGNQTAASTLNTYWNYEATSCGSGVSAQQAVLSGGADYLYSDANTDALLLRLRNDAPSFATFSGWDASAMPANSPVVAIHHPAGDAKKVSSGQHIPASSDHESHGVGWLSGTTEGGSSGSGLFTIDATDRYRLRGGLYGGSASCANTGSLANTQNRDWYSRFDVVFPQLRQYLAPQPERRNGAQPLRP